MSIREGKIIRKRKWHYNGTVLCAFTQAPLHVLATLNLTTFFAGILMAVPVWEFLPTLAFVFISTRLPSQGWQRSSWLPYRRAQQGLDKRFDMVLFCQACFGRQVFQLLFIYKMLILNAFLEHGVLLVKQIIAKNINIRYSSTISKNLYFARCLPQKPDFRRMGKGGNYELSKSEQRQGFRQSYPFS